MCDGGSSLPTEQPASPGSANRPTESDAAGQRGGSDGVECGDGGNGEAEFLLRQYRLSMARARPETDHELLEEAVRNASGGSVWGTSCPFDAALCKPYFVWALSGIGAALLASLVQCVLQVAADNAQPVRHVRFTALQLRSGAEGPAVAGPGIRVEGLSLLHRGCRLPGLVPNASLGGSGGSLAASLLQEALVNGWAFSTPAEQPPELDPVCGAAAPVSCSSLAWLGSSNLV
jgi:hypothetical protein